MRCLYCGETSWRPFRWMADGEFCSREHRKSYHERLRKIAFELAACQSAPPKAADPDASASVGTPGMQIDTNAGVCSELAPIQTSSTPTAQVFERLALASGDSDEAMLQADVYPVGLQSQKLLPLWIHDDHVAVDTWQPLPVVSAAGRAAPVGSVSGMLPAGFENHVQIKRWGLKIKFPKV